MTRNYISRSKTPTSRDENREAGEEVGLYLWDGVLFVSLFFVQKNSVVHVACIHWCTNSEQGKSL